MKQPFLTCFLGLSVTIWLSVPLSGQVNPDTLITITNTDTTTAITDTTAAKSKVSNHSLYAGAGYGSNMIYLGSSITQNQPYGYAAMTYGFKNEFFATASAVHLDNLSPYVAFWSGSLNYSHTFNSWFDISAGLSGYHVAPSLTDTLFNNFIFGELKLGFDWRILYTQLSAGAIFSQENGAFLQIKNSRYFQTPEFSRKKAYFSFDPYVNLLFGSLIKTETTTGTTTTVIPPFRKNGSVGQTSSTIKYTEKFSLLELDFGVPVSFNSGKFTFEIEPGYVLPVYEDENYSDMQGFILLIGAYFKIF